VNVPLHLSNINRYSSYSDFIAALPQAVRDTLNDRLTVNEKAAFIDAVVSLAHRCVQVGKEAGRADTERKLAQDERNDITKAVVRDIIATLTEEYGA
jgi:hypothetical protein